MWTPALGLVKLSMLFFYRRIFTGTHFTVFNWALASLVIGWTISFFFVELFGCKTNFEANWPRHGVTDTSICIDPAPSNLANAVSDIAIDVFMAILPLPFVSHTRF